MKHNKDMRLLLISINKNLHSVERIAKEARPFFRKIDKANWRDLSFSFTKNNLEIKINGKDLKTYTHLITRIAGNYYSQRYLVVNKAKDLGLRILNEKMVLALPNYNKLLQSYLLSKANIPLISSFQFLSEKNLKLKRFSYPLVIKEIEGEQGKQVYKANSYSSMIKLLKRHLFRRCLVQDYTKTKEDIRIYVIGNQMAAAYKRKAVKGFKTIPGGIKKVHQPTNKERELALKAARALKGECVGVDLIYYQGKPFILEVNLDAGFKTLEQLTGLNIAQKIVHQLLS